MTTPAGRSDPDAFAAPGGVFVPAAMAHKLSAELLPPLSEIGRRRLTPDVIAFVQALATAEVTASEPEPACDASGPWVSTAKAADVVGCTDRHVRQLAAAGRISARRHGARAWSVDLASLQVSPMSERDIEALGSYILTASRNAVAAYDATQSARSRYTRAG